MWLLIYLSLPVLSPQVFNVLFLKYVVSGSGILELPIFSVLISTVPAFTTPRNSQLFFCFCATLALFAALLSFSFKLSAPYIAFCFSHIRLLSNFPAFLCSYSYLKTVLDSFWIAYTVFRLPFPCISWFSSV